MTASNCIEEYLNVTLGILYLNFCFIMKSHQCKIGQLSLQIVHVLRSLRFCSIHSHTLGVLMIRSIQNDSA